MSLPPNPPQHDAMSEAHELVIPQSRARQAGQNALFNFVAFLYPTALTIVVTPIVLHYVGAEGYGIFALATVFVGFLAVLDFGVGAATIRYVAEAVAEEDFDRARVIVRTSLLVYAVVGLIGWGLATGAGCLFLSSWFGISPSRIDTARFVFIVAGIGFFLTMIQSALAAVPPAMQRYGITARVSLSLTTVATLGTVSVLAAGLGLRGMIIIAATEPLLALLAYRHYARQLLGKFTLAPIWQPALLREMASFSGLVFLGNISGLILFQLDKILIGVLGSTRQVTYYVVPGNIAQRIHTASATVNAVVLPSATTLNVASDRERIASLYQRATRFTAFFVATAAVTPILMANQILHYWIGANFAAASALTLQLLVATYGLLALGVPAYFLALGHNRPGMTAVFNAAMAAINVPLVVLLVPDHGNDGAAIAFLASMLPVIGFILYVERRVLRLDRSPWFTTARNLVIPVGLASLVAVVLRGEVTSLPTLLAMLAVSFAAVPVLYLLLFAPPEDRSLVRELFRL
jgi:O-antigen/teichoic acid export membrane protein